ncbi:hypothetical protein RJ640_011448 [Escallonia rubra]|uniref:DUF4005 domain-containing protein n=1 Tax=Escallonia rubra TaxID=112253 RepID=A0AA88UDN9_9ASTE|nr:hypothetical protein RJ640_011448 [Escallonia rubra]
MGKTSKWIRNFFLAGKKEKERNSSNQPASVATEIPTTPISVPPSIPKEKRRWSFRRSSATGQKDLNSPDTDATTPALDPDYEQKKHAMAVAVATAAAADAAVAAAQAAAAMIRLTAAAPTRRPTAVEEAAATKIQSVFRSYLARKALSALKGLVKLQALVRGHLVRKQATATLRCMQALVTVQARARAQRTRMVDESNPNYPRQSIHRKTSEDNRFLYTHQDLMEENIKIVEMDLGESKGSIKSRNSSYSNHAQTERAENNFSTRRSYSKQDHHQAISPAPSALTELSPRASSGHFEEYCFGTAQSSPQYYAAISKPDPSGVAFAYARAEYAESLSYDYSFFPNYMANTQSSRAKVRSHSAPKQRPDIVERQSSRRRPSLEGRNVPRAVRMQRSSSHVGSTAQNYQYPWSIKLDKSAVSLKDSECGSNSTVLTNANYCRSLVGFDMWFWSDANCQIRL